MNYNRKYPINDVFSVSMQLKISLNHQLAVVGHFTMLSFTLGGQLC